jgi:Protein of unknown function (DUF3558)
MRSVVNGRLVVLPVMMAALMGLAACTNNTPGNAVTSSTETSTSANSPSSTASGSGLAAIQPCDLLTSTELSQNSLTSNGATTGSGARSCSWDDNAYDNGLGYTAEADVRDSQGLNDFNTAGYSLSDDPIGRHQAKQARQTNGDGCIVSIGVTTTSRVDVTANTGAADINQSCALANKYAKLIEPKLP